MDSSIVRLERGLIFDWHTFYKNSVFLAYSALISVVGESTENRGNIGKAWTDVKIQESPAPEERSGIDQH